MDHSTATVLQRCAPPAPDQPKAVEHEVRLSLYTLSAESHVVGGRKFPGPAVSCLFKMPGWRNRQTQRT